MNDNFAPSGIAAERIDCQCTVDLLRPGLWEVHVWGDGDRQRTYAIEARTDDKAAEQAMRQFVDECLNLRDNVPL